MFGLKNYSTYHVAGLYEVTIPKKWKTNLESSPFVAVIDKNTTLWLETYEKLKIEVEPLEERFEEVKAAWMLEGFERVNDLEKGHNYIAQTFIKKGETIYTLHSYFEYNATVYLILVGIQSNKNYNKVLREELLATYQTIRLI